MSLIKTLLVLSLSIFVLFQPKSGNAQTLPTYHISVLVDMSGSMNVETSTGDERRIELAIDLVASRLTHDFALLDTFYYQIYTWNNNLHQRTVFSESIHSEEDAFIAESEILRRQFIARSRTLTGRALRQFLEHNTDLYCSRHVLLIVTDDPPDDPDTFLNYLAKAREAGFSVGVLLIDGASVYRAVRYFTSFEHLPHAVVRRELSEEALDDFIGEVLSESTLSTHCFSG